MRLFTVVYQSLNNSINCQTFAADDGGSLGPIVSQQSQLPTNQSAISQTPSPFAYLSSLLAQLHRLVSRNPPTLVLSDSAYRQEMIRACTNDTTAVTLNALIGSITTNPSSIRGFRASVVYSFANDPSSWPLLEWTEGQDTHVLAIFEMNHASDLTDCNWLVHYRHQNHGPSGDQGSRAQLSWRVTHLNHLQTMFEVAQHLHGILGWSTLDAHRLYCERNYENCSDEEYYLSPIFG
jgi:hypothetical protein